MANQVTLILPGRKETQAVAEPNPFLDIKVIAQHRVEGSARSGARSAPGSPRLGAISLEESASRVSTNLPSDSLRITLARDTRRRLLSGRRRIT